MILFFLSAEKSRNAVLITPAANDFAIALDIGEVPDKLDQCFRFSRGIVRVANDGVHRFRLVPFLYILTGTMNHGLNF